MEFTVVRKGHFNEINFKFKCISEYDELMKYLKEIGAPIIDTPQFLKLNCTEEQSKFWLQFADNRCMKDSEK